MIVFGGFMRQRVHIMGLSILCHLAVFGLRDSADGLVLMFRILGVYGAGRSPVLRASWKKTAGLCFLLVAFFQRKYERCIFCSNKTSYKWPLLDSCEVMHCYLVFHVL